MNARNYIMVYKRENCTNPHNYTNPPNTLFINLREVAMNKIHIRKKNQNEKKNKIEKSKKIKINKSNKSGGRMISWWRLL